MSYQDKKQEKIGKKEIVLNHLDIGQRLNWLQGGDKGLQLTFYAADI